MTRNSSSIAGGNLDAVTVPAGWADAILDPFLTMTEDQLFAELIQDPMIRDWWDTDTPVEPAHVAADFEDGYVPYDRDED